MLTVHNYKIFTKVTLFHTHNLVIKSAEFYANFMQIWTYEVFAHIFCHIIVVTWFSNFLL